MDLISIIIPVYKVESYLDRCVESVIHQTYENLEIILVDDGSPDRCPQICDEWQKKDQRIKVIHKPNGGLSDARNAGVQVANGVYIGFVDSDDWIAPEMYQRLYEALTLDQSDISACSVEMIWEETQKKQMLTQQINCVLDKKEAERELLHESKLLQPVWYKLYRKKLLQGILFEVGKQHEDAYWSYQVIGRAEKVSIIDYIGYYYVQRGNSIMGGNYTVKRLDVIGAICQRQEYFQKYFPELCSEGRVNIWTNCMYHGQQTLLHIDDSALQKDIFRYFKNIMEKYPISSQDISHMKASHKFWIQLERISLKLVCRVKNMLHVGF